MTLQELLLNVNIFNFNIYRSQNLVYHCMFNMQISSDCHIQDVKNAIELYGDHQVIGLTPISNGYVNFIAIYIK